MSSSRKRAAIMRAQAETERLRQQLMLTQHHYNVLKGVSEVLGARVDAAEAKIESAKTMLQLASMQSERGYKNLVDIALKELEK